MVTVVWVAMAEQVDLEVQAVKVVLVESPGAETAEWAMLEVAMLAV